jgi:hypothetical protein
MAQTFRDSRSDRDRRQVAASFCHDSAAGTCGQAAVEPSSVGELAEVRKREAVCSYQQVGQ